ncbi:MAG: methyl-accepting chemotaxis protein [Oscillospiraceae bacterium]|nr:methyl-accepting chemotaxis protein [Oscillospiraceae bacterium]
MKNFKVSGKLMAGFGFILAIAVFIGTISVVLSTIFISKVDTLHKLNEENAGIIEVTKAHYNWRQSLMISVINGTDFTGSLNPDTCALGTWLLGDVAKNIDDPEILKMLSDVKAPHDFIHREAERVVTSIQIGNMEAAERIVFADILPKTQEVIDLLNSSEQRFEVLIEEVDDEIITLNRMIITITVATLIIGIILAVCLVIYVSGLISKPLKILSTFMKKAGTTGDITLTQNDLEVISKYGQMRDEIGETINATAGFVKHVTEVASTLNKIAGKDLTADFIPLTESDVIGESLHSMVNNLNKMFGEINEASVQVTSGSSQISDGAQTLASGSTQQAATLEELSTSIADISKKTHENAERTNTASMLAGTIMQSAEKGSRQMEQMITAVDEINQANQNISKVIKAIDDIAFQTNILALNAAVEAARAGSAGKGFAVVAEEVRNLAAKSADSAKDTSVLISNSMEKAQLGTRIATETAESLNEIVSGISESAQIISEIAKSSNEQSASVNQINKAIDEVTHVVQQNSATAEESAAASQQMSGQANLLEGLVGQFKLK